MIRCSLFQNLMYMKYVRLVRIQYKLDSPNFGYPNALIIRTLYLAPRHKCIRYTCRSKLNYPERLVTRTFSAWSHLVQIVEVAHYNILCSKWSLFFAIGSPSCPKILHSDAWIIPGSTRHSSCATEALSTAFWLCGKHVLCSFREKRMKSGPCENASKLVGRGGYMLIVTILPRLSMEK